MADRAAVAALLVWLDGLPEDTVAAIGAIYPDSPPGGEWVDEADLAERGEPLALQTFTPSELRELLTAEGILPLGPMIEGPS